VEDTRYELPYAMTVGATAVPHAPSAQTLGPYSKLTFSQRHEGTELAHPNAEYCPTTCYCYLATRELRVKYLTT
jgi:hypothetical protein